MSLENVIVEEGKIFLIDWGVAQSNIVPHMEIADLLQNQMSDKDQLFGYFLEGYEMDREQYQSIKSDVEILTLLQAIDKLRWAIDRSPDKIIEFQNRVKSLLN